MRSFFLPFCSGGAQLTRGEERAGRAHVVTGIAIGGGQFQNRVVGVNGQRQRRHDAFDLARA